MQRITIRDDVYRRLDDNYAFQLPPSYREALDMLGLHSHFNSRLLPKNGGPRRVALYRGSIHDACNGHACLTPPQRSALDVRPGDLVHLHYDNSHKAVHVEKGSRCSCCGTTDPALMAGETHLCTVCLCKAKEEMEAAHRRLIAGMDPQDYAPWPPEIAGEYRARCVPSHTGNQWETTPEGGCISNSVYYLWMSCRPIYRNAEREYEVKWTLALNPPPLPPDYANRDLVEIDAGRCMLPDRPAALGHLEHIWSILQPLCFRSGPEEPPIPADYLSYFCYEDMILPSYRGWGISALEPWRHIK